ncbi:MAG: TMEM175 family protein [Candidatus Limnocylindrales bacterium]
MTAKPLMDVPGWEAFVHGVYAIAVTLLVLDIKVPDMAAIASGGALMDALAGLAPRYAAYVLGFLFVGTYWINVHRALRLLRGVDHWFLVLGLFMLMIISAVPFVTGLLAEYIGADNGRDHVALVVYTGWQLVLSIVANVLFRYAAHDGRLLRPGVPAGGMRVWLRIAALGPFIWLVALLSALFVSGTITLVLMAAILVIFLFEVPVDLTPVSPDQEPQS